VHCDVMQLWVGRLKLRRLFFFQQFWWRGLGAALQRPECNFTTRRNLLEATFKLWFYYNKSATVELFYLHSLMVEIRVFQYFFCLYHPMLKDGVLTLCRDFRVSNTIFCCVNTMIANTQIISKLNTAE
jgi:hypothetical protein